MGSDELPLSAAAVAVAWALLGVAACLPAPGSLCRLGTTRCDSACVELDRDPDHCGACGTACVEGALCVEGRCAPPCGGLAACEGTCADLSSDARHCGGCGNACQPGTVCVDGTCVDGCGGGARRCDMVCVDVASDESSCGECDTLCGAEESCTEGTCGCRDVLSDDTNCGICGNACLPGQRCFEGSCRPLCDGIVCAAGQVAWGRRIGDDGAADPASRLDQAAWAVAADPTGEVVVASEIRGTVLVGGEPLATGNGLDVLVARFDAEGRPLGAFELSGVGAERPRAIALTADGGVIVAGFYTSSSGTFCGLPAAVGEDGFVVRTDAGGTCLWSVHLGSAGADRITSLARAEDGSFWLTGYISASATLTPASGAPASLPHEAGQDVVVARLDAAGTLIDATSFTGPGAQRAEDVVALSDGVALTGSYAGGWTVGADDLEPSAGGQDAMWAARLADDLTVRWARGFRITSTSSAHRSDGLSIAVTEDDAVVVLGESRGEMEVDGEAVTSFLGSRDLWIGEIDPDGALSWSQLLGGEGFEEATDVLVDERGDLVVVGAYEVALEIGDTTLVAPDGANDDVFFAALSRPAAPNALPTPLWVAALTGADLDRPRAATLGTGALFVVGDFRRSLDWGRGPIWSPTGLNNQSQPVARFDAFVVDVAR